MPALSSIKMIAKKSGKSKGIGTLLHRARSIIANVTGFQDPLPDPMPIKFSVPAEDLSHHEISMMTEPPKADSNDVAGRFREIVSDPINLLINRNPLAGLVIDNRVTLHNGLSVPVSGEGAYYSDFSGILVINRGVHEPLEEFVFQQLMKKLPSNPIMIELGAYWGHYSMWMKSLYPASRVILVEPDPKNLSAGINNFKFNGLEGEFINQFVSSTGFKIDEFLQKSSIGHLTILHADVQGFEVEMLCSCHQALSNQRVDYIFVSTHSQALHDQVEKILANYEYRIEVSSGFSEATTSFDGFIFALKSSLEPIIGDHVFLARSALAHQSPSDILDYLVSLKSQV